VTNPYDDDTQAAEDGATATSRRFFSHRAFWHSAGILLALAVAWLVFRAYRQPDFLLELANMQLC
jgi:hypothetical protein